MFLLFPPPPLRASERHHIFRCSGLLITLLRPCPALINCFNSFILQYPILFALYFPVPALLYHPHFSFESITTRGRRMFQRKLKQVPLFLDYLLVAEESECKGSGYKWSNYFSSVTDCAASCRGAAKMFSHERRNDCGDRCNCYCWHDSTDGTCKKGQKKNENYNLYSFNKGILSILIFFSIFDRLAQIICIQNIYNLLRAY